MRTTGGRLAPLRWNMDGWTLDLNGVGQSIVGRDAQYSRQEEGDGLSRHQLDRPALQNNDFCRLDWWPANWGDLELSSAVALCAAICRKCSPAPRFDVNQGFPLPR